MTNRVSFVVGDIRAGNAWKRVCVCMVTETAVCFVCIFEREREREECIHIRTLFDFVYYVRLREDMDDKRSALIGAHGYCTQVCPKLVLYSITSL